MILKDVVDSGYNKGDVEALTDEIIEILKKLIVEAATYRFEQLFGYQKVGKDEIGGVFRHNFDPSLQNYDLEFVDYYTGKRVLYRNVPCYSTLTKN
jgi:hypothetical protein